MILRCLLLGLALSVNAQDVVPLRHHGVIDIPVSIGNIAFRLKSSDLVLSNTILSWIDEVHGRTYTNNTGVNQPTNSWNLGAFFKAGNYLRNNDTVLASWLWQPTQGVFIAYQAVSPANFGSVVGNNSAEFCIGYLTAPNCFGNFGAGQTKWINSYPITAVNYVILSVGGAAPVQAYSNGVSALTFTASGQGFQWDYVGVNQAAHSDTFQGYIKEIIAWTNPAALTAQNVTALFTYATNQGYLP